MGAISSIRTINIDVCVLSPDNDFDVPLRGWSEMFYYNNKTFNVIFNCTVDNCYFDHNN